MTRFLSALVAAAALLAGGLPALAGPLHEAVETGDIDQVKQAIAEGADVNQEDSAFGTPLFLAASRGHAAIAVLLIENGADVSMEDLLLGWRPLHGAASAGHLDVVEILIEHGADVNAANRLTGQMPIHYAAASAHFDVVELLIALGASTPAEPKVTRGVFSVPVSRTKVGQDWNTRGYDCSARIFESGWTSSNHVHHSDEVITPIEGRVALVVAGQRFEAEPGDELFLPTNTMHRLENSHDGLLKMFYGMKHAVGAPPNKCSY